MLKYLPFFSVCIVAVNCQTWTSRACLVNRNEYFMNIIQNVITRIEKEIKWCNLKINDVNQQINERLFKWHAQGTANYTNGFLLHFKNLDVTNILSQFSTRTVNGTSETLVSVNGLLNFRNLYVGYDVLANIDGFDTQHFTGVFSYTLVAIRCTIIKNLKTKETTVTTAITSSTAAVRRMTFMPQNSISEVLSRHFAAFHISFAPWGVNYLAPLITEIASKTDLPKIRYDNRC